MKTTTKKQLEKLSHRFQVTFALFCAKQAIHLVENKDREACDNCIKVVEAYLNGEANKEDCKQILLTIKTGSNSNNAIYTTVLAAIYTINAACTINAAYAAYYAAFANNNKEQTIKEQHTYYNELLNFDSIFEKEVLL